MKKNLLGINFYDFFGGKIYVLIKYFNINKKCGEKVVSTQMVFSFFFFLLRRAIRLVVEIIQIK